MRILFLGDIIGKPGRDVVAAYAEHLVLSSQGMSKGICDPDQQRISRRVTSGVIDVLEVVDVEIEHSKLSLAGTGTLPWEGGLERCMVAE